MDHNDCWTRDKIQILRRKSNDPIDVESLDIIVRNATRLQHLTEERRTKD